MQVSHRLPEAKRQVQRRTGGAHANSDMSFIWFVSSIIVTVHLLGLVQLLNLVNIIENVFIKKYNELTWWCLTCISL